MRASQVWSQASGQAPKAILIMAVKFSGHLVGDFVRPRLRLGGTV